jgi:hypothetical protein
MMHDQASVLILDTEYRTITRSVMAGMTYPPARELFKLTKRRIRHGHCPKPVSAD